MRLSWDSKIRVAGFCLGGALAFVDDAWAYKVTTHQVVAVRSAERLPDGDLKSILLGNELYLRSGAMGPDLFLLPGGSSYPSDLAHYCKTDELAKNFLSLSKGRSGRAQAFAYGWFSHNIADSVAHPWVNGFTGKPYASPETTVEGIETFLLNMTHIGIETWVDKQIFTQVGTSIPRRYSQAKALVAAFNPFINDAEIQQLFIDAYEATYQKQDCIGKRYEKEKLTKEEIAAAGRRFRAAIGADKFGPVVKDFVDPKLFELDLRLLVADAVVREILRTWEDYLDRSVQYLEKSWQATGPLPNFNLDQGVAKGGNAELADFWGTVLDPDGRSVRVFDVPGKTYNNGEAPVHDDRCVSREVNPDCSQAAQFGPGGDNPDDATAAGTAVAVAVPSRSVAGAHWRLATKKGKRWPSLFEKLSNQAEGLDTITDPAAFLEAFAAMGEAFDKAREDDTEFGAMTSSYHGDPRPFDGSADVALLASGFVSAARSVIQSFLEPALRVEPFEISAELAHAQPILVIPTGGLSGLSDGEQARVGLGSYVDSGATVIVFAQQHGSDYSILPTPDGRPIRAWGWTEDNSCYFNAAYIETFHPILASQSNALVTSSIDGYFDSIPES
ncbi:MAG: zinc dependent phospholipase C family protein, partial [Acidobacteria bacterium]|nr:zinc dependent phospholipase C family protein [Acidobacteriota bacterium]